MDKHISPIVGLALMVVAAVAIFIVLVYFDIGGVLDNDGNDAVTTIEPTPPPIRVTMDYANGFICYDNTAAIECHPTYWGVPPPEIYNFIEGRLGQVYRFPAPILTPTPFPSFLDGIN